MSDQAELAERLLRAMDDDLAEVAESGAPSLTVADLLDDLASAGLRLVPDQEGITSRAYLGVVHPEPLDEFEAFGPVFP